MKIFQAIRATVTAILLVPVGFGFIWFGNSEVSVYYPVGIMLTAVGILLLLVVMQTGQASSLGLIVAGVVVTIFGAVALLVPGVANAAVGLVRSVSPVVGSDGIATVSERWIVFGFVLAIGFVFLGAAVTTWFAHRPTARSSSPALRGLISIGLALSGNLAGFGFITRTDQHIVIFGAVILGATLVTGMVSSAGLFVSGSITFVIGGLSLIFRPLALAIANSPIVGGNGMEVGAQAALQLGFTAAVGAIYVSAAVVTRSAQARARRRASV